MKIRKYKWLLSLTTIAAVLTPVAIFNGNNNTNGYSIEKQSVKNNADTDSQENGESTSTLQIPESVSMADISHLAPNADDLYNEYAYDSGYVIKDETSHTIYFYNWFKEELWNVTLNHTSISGFPSKTVKTMNVKGALTSTGSYDTKLFVYGNFSDGGSYLFELDMTNGALIENSLITNTNEAAAETTGTESSSQTTQTVDTSLISDANLLTVIDQNTIIVTQKNVKHTTTTSEGSSSSSSSSSFNGDNLISFSEIKFNDGSSSPTITTYKDVSIYKGSSAYMFGEILGVISTNNQYLFAVNAIGAVSSNTKYAVSVYEFYFKKSTASSEESTDQETSTTDTLVATNFNETSPLQNNPTASGAAFDSLPFSNMINPSFFDSSSSSQTITDTNKLQSYLNDKCNNFSVKYTGTIEKPKMLISLNWDSTDLTLSPGEENGANNNNGYNKILVSTLDDSTDSSAGPKLATYTISTSTNLQASLTYLGISNLIYTRDANVVPYAVCVAAGASGGKSTLYFNFVKLDAELTNTTASTGNNNNNVNFEVNSSSSSSNYWFNSEDIIANSTSYSSSSSSSTNKIDFFLNFIPGTGMKQTSQEGQDSSSTTSNYFGYISTGSENNESKKVDYQENYFSIPSKITSASQIPITDLKLNDFEWLDINSLLTEFKPTASTDSTINSNSFATKATIDAINAKLGALTDQVVPFTVDYPTGDKTDGTTNAISETNNPYSNVIDKSQTIIDVLQYDTNDGLIQIKPNTYIEFKVNNWWNDGTTTIRRTFNPIQLNKASDFAFQTNNISTIADSNADNTAIADYVEAKYPIATFTKDSAEFKANFKNFISDSLSQLSDTDLGATLKQILLNSIDSAVNGSAQSAQNESKSVTLHSVADQANSYDVGQYIKVSTDNASNSVTITYDLSSTGIPSGDNTTIVPITLTYKNFSSDANPSNFATYDTWVQDKQSQNTPVTPQPGDNNNPSQTPDNNNNNNNATSSQLEGWKIALIVIAVVLVIMLIVGLYFWMKKRNGTKYNN